MNNEKCKDYENFSGTGTTCDPRDHEPSRKVLFDLEPSLFVSLLRFRF